MTEVTRLGSEKQDCVCGCGLFGTPRRKQWQDGLGPHVSRCQCRRCRGGRHKARAATKERRIAKDTGGTRSELSGALNGYDGRAGLDVWEHTAQVAVVRGFFKWWDGKGTQDKVARMMSLSGVRHHLVLEDRENNRMMVVTPYRDWADLVSSSEDLT